MRPPLIILATNCRERPSGRFSRLPNCNSHAQGFAYFEDIETPYEWGKLWLSYGDWLRSAEAEEYRDEKGALEAYQAARELFERIGQRRSLRRRKGGWRS